MQLERESIEREEGEECTTVPPAMRRLKKTRNLRCPPTPPFHKTEVKQKNPQLLLLQIDKRHGGLENRVEDAVEDGGGDGGERKERERWRK